MTMKEALMMMGGMTDTDDLTAIAAHVLEGETFLSAGSDDPQTGAMPDCGASQYAASMGEEGDDYAFEGFPEGWYHDNTKARLYKGTVREYLGITAAKIAKGQTIAGVAGSWYGNKAMISAFAVRGFDGSSSDYQTYEEDSFTMPADGMVYYGGANAGYKHISKCQILKNGTVVNSRDTSASEWYSGWRGTMFNQSFSARKGDVIKVICEQSSGTHGMSCIQAVIVY